MAADGDVESIEVYEWKEGASRPMSERNSARDAIAELAIPPRGHLPARGDVLTIPLPGDSEADHMGVVRFVVLERELVWWTGEDQDTAKPAPWLKMWIHVRRLHDYRKPAPAL